MNISLKEILATVYILCLGILLFFVFSYLDLKDLSNYSYIKEKGELLLNFKNNNLIWFVAVFFILSLLWILFLGFGSPVCILAGFIFGKWYGTLVTLISFSIGSTLLYFVVGYYFKNFVKQNLPNKINSYIDFFKKNAFFYFTIFRLTGGGGIPFPIQNILPVVFNMKIKEYFYSTLIGLTPALFIMNALGSGIKSLMSNNEILSYKNIIYDPVIYWPIIGFILILFFSFIFRNKIFKK
jgi:uncharacterized membrane protein YdjX (TVP38/TMEM64 family)